MRDTLSSTNNSQDYISKASRNFQRIQKYLEKNPFTEENTLAEPSELDRSDRVINIYTKYVSAFILKVLNGDVPGEYKTVYDRDTKEKLIALQAHFINNVVVGILIGTDYVIPDKYIYLKLVETGGVTSREQIETFIEDIRNHNEKGRRTESTVQAEIDEEIENINMPFDILSEVMKELLLNAEKSRATEYGIKVRKEDEGKVSVIISDNGRRITDAVLGRIFTEGFSTTNTSGFGLGKLKEIIEEQGGTLEIEQEDTSNEGEKKTLYKRFIITI